ncbi:4'-phosphopantetheinyl transferase superfamily protein [Blastopirellula sp. J2-11]|uniref:4'-phosphopantetheinyl transferase family protein n=1 Tax=Blastopirellula sp. J2-11 TaxID=2943192 RepID=UPI0021C9DD2C|nr:4'-phosphopantetheinyl transferase superfamily protein [Blastopirellula sp. J2-11]UUO06406.1 4'-phosphopantetheinyl transferase superfamily protein [Blastopirellula sp. J2-11]
MIRLPEARGSRLAPLTGMSAEALHLWSIPLRTSKSQVAQLREVLSASEREKAESFLLDEQTQRYIVCRGAVRQILAGYLEMAPKQLSLISGKFGKPQLEHQDSLWFNVTHSGDLAVLAISTIGEVGVDIEQIREIRGLARMVDRCLAPGERPDVLRLPAAEKDRQFLRYWTHKEAYLKTFGVGIRRPLEKLEIDLVAPPSRRVMNHFGHFPDELAASVTEFCPAEGYVGAISVCGSLPAEIAAQAWVGGRFRAQRVG